MQASQSIKTTKMANTKNTSKLDTKNKKINCMFFKNKKNKKNKYVFKDNCHIIPFVLENFLIVKESSKKKMETYFSQGKMIC